MKTLTAFALSLCVAAGTSVLADEEKTEPKVVNKGDRKGHVMKDVIPKDEVPPAPILNVSQAIDSMQLQSGFVLENVVSEPNVFNPVTMVFDGDGRIWVCEMTRYMPDTQGTGEMAPEGNIAVLEDTDGDGKVDKRTVFLNDIILPRTISLVKGGIFYADHTQLYFTEVINKDGVIKPGLREVVDPTYAKGGNLEHKPNTMLYGIDNWYYNAKSSRKYQVLDHDAALPKGGKEIYRNKFWKLVSARTDYRGQWGLTMDDYGRLYHNGNWQPAQGEFLLPGSLIKNPDYKGKQKAQSIGSSMVYSARMNTGVNRGYLDGVLYTEGENRGKIKNFTAASGSVIYRGDQFPEQFYGMAITPEPAANLISARYITEQEGILDGEAVYPNSELLASTDERFRPVNLYTAPDGSLYLLDMYHGILQHKEFLTTYLSDQIKDRELDKNNNTMGRIYRLRWQDKPLGKQPQLTSLTAAQLVPYLTHPNGWWRDSARRMIVQNPSPEAISATKALLESIEQPIYLINALWTLYGLNALDLDTLEPLLNSTHVKVQAAAVAVSKSIDKSEHHKLAKLLLGLSQSHYEVGLQIAVIAGEIDSPLSIEASRNVLNSFVTKPHVREAIISGLGHRTAEFKKLLPNGHEDPEFMYILDNLGKSPEDKTSRPQLSKQGQQMYDLGKELYYGRGACFGCHANDGNGIEGMGPTFWDSKWVVENPEVLARVMLHGLMGDIWVRGRLWQTPMVMPGMINRPDMTDQDLAAMATYIRNTWTNAADINSYFSPEVFKEVREKTKHRVKPYTQESAYK